MTMGSRLKQLRNEYKYTQREVADYLDISQSQLAKVESDERKLKLTKLIKLAVLYDCTEEYLLYGEKEEDRVSFPHFTRNKGVSLTTLTRMNKIVRNLVEMQQLDQKR